MRSNLSFVFLFLVLIVIVFRSWFSPGLLSAFDLPYFSSIMMRDASMLPYSWGWHVGLDGFARFFSPYSWVFLIINAPQAILGNILGMDWATIERIIYLYPFLALALISPAILFKSLFSNSQFYLLAILVYVFNTYALLLAGGEIFLALAYALIPIILMISMKIINSAIGGIKYSIVLGLLVSLQVIFDPRITYVTLSMVGIYLLLYCGLRINEFRERFRETILNTLYSILYIFVIPLGITVLLHAFWILPSIVHGGNPVEALGVSHSTTQAVNYLSFANFENSISLLQPNWPENIFGKVDFMKPEFLLLPILAFASLLFVRRIEDKKQKEYILFFALLGLIGVFISKGSNDPFGEIYFWMFDHIPGFNLFRDPTKWYPLIAISYSVLIPFTVWKVCELLKSQPKFLIFNFKFLKKSKIFNVQNAFLLFVVCYQLLLIRPAILGQLGGLFKATAIPQDYVKLEKFLYDQPGYFKTLWFPLKQRFSYYSNQHSTISAQALFDVYDNDSLFRKLQQKGSEEFLREASIKYIIVPFDSEKEIFLTDRKYDNKLYLQTISGLQGIKWLKPVGDFGRIAVFELSDSKDHFWSPSKNLYLKYKYLNPTEYLVNVKNAERGDVIVFSENYDCGWIAHESNFKIQSSLFGGVFNSFTIPEEGDYSFKVSYSYQSYAIIGQIISFSAFFLVLVASLLLMRKRVRKNN